jgi:hypothetical protein
MLNHNASVTVFHKWQFKLYSIHLCDLMCLLLLFHLLYANGNLLSMHGLTYCSIIRAFLVEEQKIVKKVLKIQKSKEKLAAKAQA